MDKRLNISNNILSVCFSSARPRVCGDSTSSDDKEEFRKAINALDWGTDTTFVIGHKTPDVDAIASALSYAALMRAMGHNAVAKIVSPINRETAYISEKFGFDIPEEMSSVEAGTRLILTDHAESAQSVEGVKEAKILQIIDHHTPGDIDATSDSSVYIRRDYYGSTCTLIWLLYKEADIKVDNEIAKILLAGILSDTRNLTKSNTTPADALALGELKEQLKLTSDSIEKLFKEMSNVAHDYSGMTDKEIFLVDYKDYDIGGLAMGIASNSWYDESAKDEFFKRTLAVMPQIASEKNRNILFAKVDVFRPNTDPETMGEKPNVSDGSYILYYGRDGFADIAKKIAETAFGKSTREGICFYARKLNRKTHMVPMITEVVKLFESV